MQRESKFIVTADQLFQFTLCIDGQLSIVCKGRQLLIHLGLLLFMSMLEYLDINMDQRVWIKAA